MSLKAVRRLVELTMLAYLSFLLAVFGAFLVPRSPVPGVSAGVVLAVVGNYALGTSGRRAVGHPSGALVPALVWLAVAMAFASGRREGDVVLTSSLGSIGFLVLGAVTYAVVVGRRPAPRPEPDDDMQAQDPTP